MASSRGGQTALGGREDRLAHRSPEIVSRKPKQVRRARGSSRYIDNRSIYTRSILYLRVNHFLPDCISITSITIADSRDKTFCRCKILLLHTLQKKRDQNLTRSFWKFLCMNWYSNFMYNRDEKLTYGKQITLEIL